MKEHGLKGLVLTFLEALDASGVQEPHKTKLLEKYDDLAGDLWHDHQHARALEKRIAKVRKMLRPVVELRAEDPHDQLSEAADQLHFGKHPLVPKKGTKR